MSFYETPLFVDLLLGFIYVLIAAAIGLCLWSVSRTFRQRERKVTADDKLARRLAWIMSSALVFVLLVTCLFASTQPLHINGEPFSDTFWLRVSDMLINSSVILILIAAICVALSAMGIGRMIKKK